MQKTLPRLLLGLLLVLLLWIPQPLHAQRSNCSPSYPDVCIPPPPPDLDCGDIPERNFTVQEPDPHNFDRDKDGIGCEQG